MKADLVAAFFGARGQGKSTLAKQLIAERRPPRLLIFDPMDEYGGAAERAASLQAMLAAARGKTFAVRYVPELGDEKALPARFDAFCRIALAMGELLMLVEELQLVTRPSWAPAAWSECTLRGRHRGLSLVGLSQRPASVDKNFLSNCSTVTTCRLNFDDDVLCLARLLGVARERVAGLRRFEYLARDMDTGEVAEGMTPAPAKQKKPRR